MATYSYTVVTYPCRRCKEDALKRPGFVTTPVIACHVCGHETFVTREFVLHHWQRKLCWYSWLFLVIAGVAGYFAISAVQANQVWEMAYRPHFMGEPYDTISAYVVIFGGLALGALIVAAIVGVVVGSVIGNIVAGRVCSD